MVFQLPVVALARDGAKAFIQVGDRPMSRSWASLQTLDGDEVDIEQLIQTIRNTEDASSLSAGFPVPSQATLVTSNNLPPDLSYQLLADMPVLPESYGVSLHVAVCIFWP